jgi:predicted ATPase
MRADLPIGTVTFLFTDVEGSTKLLHEFGAEAYARVLADHRRAVRESAVAEGGVEVDTQGDAFFFAFASAQGATRAAHAIVDRLAGGPISLRIGLHTGTPLVTDEGYVGNDVHLAARIAAAGYGGQVLLSRASRELLDGYSTTDLGEHRLRDIEGPVSIYQLGSQRFPPLKTVSNTNLPRPTTSFVGRQRERDALVSMLAEGTRLVTLSGPGGSGKTRLAIEVATELVSAFNAGVFWVGLATLRDPALVSEEIKQTLGATEDLVRHIGDREMLLVLDNFEQVVEAASELAGLLERCPDLALLVTSREVLRIKGEVDHPVLSLDETDAVKLFCSRAQIDPDRTIEELCRQLEELPLALELAAARTRVLSPVQILARVSQRLDLFEGGRDSGPRQKTLRATIAWSHDLLDEREQDLFARLAVFRGGCSLEAAEEVADADLNTLQSLVEKSLLRHTDERFWQLETIRDYARERLSASPNEADLRRRHAVFALAFAETEAARLAENDQPGALARIEVEHDNLRAALEWAHDSGEDELVLRLVAALRQYWIIRGSYHELDTWLPIALERGSSPQARLSVYWGAWSHAFFARQDMAGAAELLPDWHSLAVQEHDERMLLLTLNAEALDLFERAEDLERARSVWMTMEKQARAAGDRQMIAVAIANQAGVAYRAGDYRTSLEQYGQAADEFGDQSNTLLEAGNLGNCGWSCIHLSDPGHASTYFRDSLTILERLSAVRTPTGVIATGGLGVALVAQRDLERGATLLGAASELENEVQGNLFDKRERQELDDAAATAEAVHGEEAFAAAWRRGQDMNPDEIAAFALAE